MSDNGKRFDGLKIIEFCEKCKIKRLFYTPYHPLNNNQVVVVNKILKHTLRAKLEDKSERWAHELPDVLWAYRIIMRNSTDDNDGDGRLDLDMLEQQRLAEVHKNASYNICRKILQLQGQTQIVRHGQAGLTKRAQS